MDFYLAALPKHSGLPFELPMITLTAASMPIGCVGEVWVPLSHSRSFLVRVVCGRSAQSAAVQTFLPSRQQLTELLDCRQLAGTDLIVFTVRGFGDPLSDGDEPFVHLGALIRLQ
jgi:hypothetical protein